MKKRAKVMLPEIKNLINMHALRSNEKREVLADIIIKEIKKKYPDEVPPSWETVIKRISHARRHENPFDKPWHLGLMSTLEYSIPAGAVPYILEVQSWLENLPEHDPPPQRVLTIRQAVWISRLYRAVTAGNHKKPEINWYLYSWADAYASYEWICKLSDTQFDTTQFDQKLSKGELPPGIDSGIETIFAGGKEYSTSRLIEEIEKGKGDQS